MALLAPRFPPHLGLQAPRLLRAFTINCPAADLSEFQWWRTSIHNVVCYRRRQCRWWRSVGVWGWWDGGLLRGVIELGSITAEEFAQALRRHGPIGLRPVEVTSVRVAVYEAARTVVRGVTRSGRYQFWKIAIAPVALHS
jgi:hypothetical protein